MVENGRTSPARMDESWILYVEYALAICYIAMDYGQIFHL
jgi:hypothetical protein